MKQLSVAGALISTALLVITGVGAVILDKAFSIEVQFIAPKSPETVKLNKALWEKGQPVADIYGIPTNQRARVVFADKGKIVRPPEDPQLVLMTVDKQQGENPLQLKTVWFLAVRLMIAFAAGALALLGLFVFLRHRERQV